MKRHQQIRFCTSSDGVRLAFSADGHGTPLLRAPHWITHLEHDEMVWGHLYDQLRERFTLIRFDQRGCGLSDRDVGEISFDAWVRDMEAVADSAGLERFAVLGVSQGAAIGAAYAARHPERVSHLIAYGGYAHGWAMQDLPPVEREKLETLGKLIELGWSGWDSSLRQVFTSQLMPEASPAQACALNDLMQRSASTQTALRIYEAFNALDVRAEASLVRCPTLVAHATGDRRVPFEDGRKLAGLFPNATFLPLDSQNHLLLAGEPALSRFMEGIDGFIPRHRPVPTLPDLTPRENAVLEYVAQGLDNLQIAARLSLSEKTIRNYIVTILDKLQTETRAQAIVHARDLGFGQAKR